MNDDDYSDDTNVNVYDAMFMTIVTLGVNQVQRRQLLTLRPSQPPVLWPAPIHTHDCYILLLLLSPNNNNKDNS